MIEEKINIKETVDIIFDNPRISAVIKFKLTKRKEALDEICTKYNLFSYVLGSASFKDIERLIPNKNIDIYDLQYSSEEFKDYLRDFESISIRSRIEDSISNEVKDLVSDYDEELSFYNNFIDSSPGDDYLSKVWINALSILFLLKWLIYKKEIDKKSDIHEKIEYGLTWLKENCNWKDKNLFLYTANCQNESNISYPTKIYETSIALQVLLRTYKYKTFALDIDFKPTVDILLSFKETEKKDDRTLTWWPSDITFNTRDIKDIKNKVYEGDVGATSHVIQLLSEIIKNNVIEDKEHVQSLKEEIINGTLWLVTRQGANGGWYLKKDLFSIEQSCEAIQAILKFDQMRRKGLYSKKDLDESIEYQIHDSIRKGFKWLSEQFCIEKGDLLVYAWPEDNKDNINASTCIPCSKNTALAVSTYLRANTNPHSFIITKPIFWLFKEDNPRYKFNNIYKYCTLIDYLIFNKQ